MQPDRALGRWRGALAGALVAWLTSAAGAAWAQESENDPYESFNRAVFTFNLTFDRYLLEPVARGYRFVTPRFVRTGISNFLDNLRTPVILANDLLQGEAVRATETVGRFMLNSIMGVGGLVDVGGKLGMPPRHYEDFGQTLATYGLGSGPYLMLPLLGPSNPRDALGSVVDFAFNPLTYVAPTEVNLGRQGADVVSFREQNLETIEELQRSSLDFYAATRTLTRQRRLSEIRNGAPAEIEDIYDEDLYELDDLEDPDAP